MTSAVSAVRALSGRPASRPHIGFRALSVAALAATYLLIVAGAVVRVTGSGQGCGTSNDWPLCEGRLLPPLRQDAIIEFTHRWLAATATATVLALAVVAWLRYRRLRRVVRAATIVVGLFVLEIVLGAITVKLKLPGGVILIHLANALLLLGALAYIAFVTVTWGTPRGQRWAEARSSSAPPLAASRAVVGAAAAVYVLALSGAFVVDRAAGAACAGWPVCGNGFELPAGELASINMLHRVVAGVATAAVAYALIRLRRATPHDSGVRIVVAMASLLLLAQIAAGALVVEMRLPAALRGAHVALAGALWATMVLTALMARTAHAEEPAAEQSLLPATAS